MSELCPKCRQVREMIVTTTTRTVTKPDGTLKRLRTNTYHCSVCHSFVRSEDSELTESERSDNVENVDH